MTTYNPNEAKELVETLQKRAVAARIYGPSYGALFAMFAVVWLEMADFPIAFFVAIPGGMIGYQLGCLRSFALKVQIQSLLCQMKIEENTRK